MECVRKLVYPERNPRKHGESMQTLHRKSGVKIVTQHLTTNRLHTLKLFSPAFATNDPNQTPDWLRKNLGKSKTLELISEAL